MGYQEQDAGRASPLFIRDIRHIVVIKHIGVGGLCLHRFDGVRRLGFSAIIFAPLGRHEAIGVRDKPHFLLVSRLLLFGLIRRLHHVAAESHADQAGKPARKLLPRELLAALNCLFDFLVGAGFRAGLLAVAEAFLPRLENAERVEPVGVVCLGRFDPLDRIVAAERDERITHPLRPL